MVHFSAAFALKSKFRGLCMQMAVNNIRYGILVYKFRKSRCSAVRTERRIMKHQNN